MVAAGGVVRFPPPLIHRRFIFELARGEVGWLSLPIMRIFGGSHEMSLTPIQPLLIKKLILLKLETKTYF